MPDEELLKVFELDFGDTNFLSDEPQDIIDAISVQIKDAGAGDELDFNIKVNMMPKKEYESLPEADH